MAITLDFSICEKPNCTQFEFTEKTGTYSTNNTTGWGSPNDVHTGAEAATLTVTRPDGQIFTINLFTYGYPINTVNQTTVFNQTDIGYTSGSKFPTGWYTFKYTVTRTTATAWSYTQTLKFFFTCQTSCCVDDMFADIEATECTDCQEEKLEFAFNTKALLMAAQYAAKCGQEDKAENLLELVEKYCNDTNCSTCD